MISFIYIIIIIVAAVVFFYLYIIQFLKRISMLPILLLQATLYEFTKNISLLYITYDIAYKSIFDMCVYINVN